MLKNIGGIMYECYPLTAAQLLNLTNIKDGATHEVENIGTGQYLQMKLNIAALREALNRAVERCESMRLRIWKDPDTGEQWQYVVPYQNEFFEYYDFSEWKEEKVTEVLDKWTSQPFDTFGGKLSRIVIVSLPDGYNGFYINVHHACMDSSSVIAFTKDVIEIYSSLFYGLPYPKPMASYIGALKKDLTYEGSKKYQRDEEYWQKQLELPEPMYTDYTGQGRLLQLRKENKNRKQRWGLLASSDGRGNTITYELSVDSTMKIMEFARQYDLPVSVIILHAIRTVLSKFNNNEKDITITDLVSRRSTLDNKKCGGVRMHAFPLRTIMPLNTTVLESIRMIKKAQDELFIHADYDPLKVFGGLAEKFGGAPGSTYASVDFTYQPGTLAAIGESLKGIPFKSRWYSSGKQPKPMYITAMHRPSDGGLNFYFGYQTECATPEEIEFLYYFTGRVLFRSIENPDKTLKEIIDMT
ncbi:MAG: peptide synthetase [Ruminiclostridium sp.]|nr:peptide synthetase [Ruminiclostridium sp.]